MAHELTKLVRTNASFDWTRKASVRAKLRLLVKKLLNRYGYPPDAAKIAIDTVLRQAERELLMPRTLVLTAGQKIELCQMIGATTAKFDVPTAP